MSVPFRTPFNLVVRRLILFLFPSFFLPWIDCSSAHPVGASVMLLGGFGFLSRLHGLSIDNLVEAEAVLADGSIVIVNEKEHPGMLLIAFPPQWEHILTRKIEISGGVCAVLAQRSVLRLATKHARTLCPSSSQAT